MHKENRNIKDYMDYLIDISDADILEAMKEMKGYIDITFSDFKELYRFAVQHALERLTHFAKAREIMTREVIFVERKTLSKQVAELMSRRGISGVPVVGAEGKVEGVISEKDFMIHMGSKDTKSCMDLIAQCLGNKGCVAMPIRELRAEDIMTSPAITVSEETSVFEIVNIFAEQKINRVPVVNEEKKLVGIVSRADVLRTPLPRAKG